jgi:hypothetical protein
LHGLRQSDAVIELVAVWVPAIIAVTAFGVAGVDAGKKIYNRMLAVHTVMDATGQAVPPLTNNFKHLAAAVRPEVYQLFGDALVVMAKRGGAFNQVAIGTGRVLDQLAARFVVAITTAAGSTSSWARHHRRGQAGRSSAASAGSSGPCSGPSPVTRRSCDGRDAITKVLESAAQAAEPVIAFGWPARVLITAARRSRYPRPGRRPGQAGRGLASSTPPSPSSGSTPSRNSLSG